MNPDRLITHQAGMKAQEVLRLYAEGFRLVCRYCKVEFTTIPEALEPNEIPISVTCPSNINHMHLRIEPEQAMKGVRSGMRTWSSEAK